MKIDLSAAVERAGDKMSDHLGEMGVPWSMIHSLRIYGLAKVALDAAMPLIVEQLARDLPDAVTEKVMADQRVRGFFPGGMSA